MASTDWEIKLVLNHTGADATSNC